MCMYSTFFCINEIIHVEAEILSKEVCSLRLFSGNEVDMYLSADSVCVSLLKRPICGFGGNQKCSSYFRYLPSVPSG